MVPKKRQPDPVKVEAGRLGGFSSWANTVDRAARMQPAWDASWRKLLDEHDGDPKRAEAARKAQLAREYMRASQVERRAKAWAAFKAEVEAGEPDG